MEIEWNSHFIFLPHALRLLHCSWNKKTLFRLFLLVIQEYSVLPFPPSFMQNIRFWQGLVCLSLHFFGNGSKYICHPGDLKINPCVYREGAKLCKIRWWTVSDINLTSNRVFSSVLSFRKYNSNTLMCKCLPSSSLYTIKIHILNNKLKKAPNVYHKMIFH